MGLFINIYLNPKGISQQEWEDVYQESLILLRKFPAPLMRKKIEEVGSKTRAVYTTDLVYDADTPDEFWITIGDLTSYQRAEDFRLYRNLEKQCIDWKTQNELDVIWAEPGCLNYVNGNGINLFGGKTQGYPYHLAILAVAILLEIRFPEKCYLIGDIEYTQVEQMSSWVHSILDTPLITPLCMDGERLYNRLSMIYDNPRDTIKRFQALFSGSDDEQFAVLLRYADKTAVFDVFIEELSQYSSLSQYGAIQLISQFLVVTQNVKELLDIVLQAEKAKKKKSDDFNLESLLTMLCDNFLTISYEEREPLDMFTYCNDTLRTIEDNLANIFTKLGGAPSAIDLYVDSSELLEIFCSCQPEQRAAFQEIIGSCEQKCREELEKTKTLIGEMEQKMPKAEEPEKGEPEAQVIVKASPGIDFVGKNLSEAEAYILKQVVLQTKTFKDAEKGTMKLGSQLAEIITKHPDMFASEERSYYLEGIYAASYENGFALRESAWSAIDQEQDIGILRKLLAYALVTEQGINFWHWRIHIFESQNLWKFLLEAQQMLCRDTL